MAVINTVLDYCIITALEPLQQHSFSKGANSFAMPNRQTECVSTIAACASCTVILEVCRLVLGSFVILTISSVKL
jgi:hypothetical protein